MWACEFRPGRKGRWLRLSEGATEHQGWWHMFGWMLVLANGSWRVTEGDDMRAQELIDVFRKRQAKVDASGALDQCEESGVQVWADGDGLRVKGPLTDELREKLKACKPELLKLLAAAPAWDDAEAADLQERLKTAYGVAWGKLNPAEDDQFSIAGRNVCGDLLASVARAVAVRRMDLLRRRVDYVLGWFATLDKTLHDLRKPGGWAVNRPVDVRWAQADLRQTP